MDRKRWSKINKFAKKIKCITYLGGKCEKCSEENYFKLCFHHNNDFNKEFDISKILNFRWSIIENELNKCSLLCYNCHQEIHYDINGYKTRNKKILLKYINLNKCEICGYNSCSASLDFHHTDPDNKIINIGRLLLDKGVMDIKNEIEIELNKCIVLCKNCHMNLHNNNTFFYDNYREILKESYNIKEIQGKIDRIEVEKLYKNGMKQIEIAKYYNASKGTISNIIRILNIKTVQ